MNNEINARYVDTANFSHWVGLVTGILHDRELAVPPQFVARFRTLYDDNFPPASAVEELIKQHMTKQRLLVSYQVMAWTHGRWEPVQYGTFTQNERDDAIERAAEWESGYAQRTIVKQHTTGTIFDSNLGGEL